MESPRDSPYSLPEAADGLESQDIRFTTLEGIIAGLQGWRLSHFTENLADLREREAYFKNTGKELADLINNLQGSIHCEYSISSEIELRAHSLRRLGNDRALFDQGILDPNCTYIINYAAEHHVPQASTYDIPEGFQNSHQLYLGDTRAHIAFSFNQLALSLINGADLKLKY